MTKKRFSSLLTLLLVLSLLLPSLAEAPPAPKVVHQPLRKVTLAKLYDAPTSLESPMLVDQDLVLIDFINIGIGDAIVIRAGGQVMLIDGGTAHRAPVLKSFFEQEGIENIDFFFNTHVHDDHIQAQTRLMKEGVLPTAFLCPNPVDYNFPDHQEAVLAIQAGGVEYHQLSHLEEMYMGEARLTFFRDERVEPGITINHRSMVMSLRFGENSILFPADCVGQSLLMLCQNYPDLVDVEVLKSPHHGINRLHQETFDLISPELVVITSNQKNGENLAAQLRPRKIPHYYISGGHVRLVTDGQSWYVQQDPPK